MSLQLEELLDLVRDALIAGNFTQLSDFSAKVDALTETLPRLDRPTAERLGQKADRNACLLQAAQRGIRAARQRIGEIKAGPALSTYDMRGRREVIPGPSALLPRRV